MIESALDLLETRIVEQWMLIHIDDIYGIASFCLMP